MRKLIVILAAIAMVGAFTATAMADVSLYGSARFRTDFSFSCAQAPPRLEKMRIPATTTVKLIIGSPKSSIYFFIKNNSININPDPTAKKYSP